MIVADLSMDFSIDKMVQRGTALKYGDFSFVNVFHKRAIAT